jgi:hypothetical protein
VWLWVGGCTFIFIILIVVVVIVVIVIIVIIIFVLVLVLNIIITTTTTIMCKLITKGQYPFFRDKVGDQQVQGRPVSAFPLRAHSRPLTSSTPRSPQMTLNRPHPCQYSSFFYDEL